MATSMLKQIDDGLGRWYKKNKAKGYYNSDGVGKFLFYCEDNGIEADDIPDEIEGDANDCSIIEFDENYPIIKNNNTALRDVVKYCYEHEDAYADDDDQIFKPLKLTKEFWDIANEEKSIRFGNIKEIYAQTCRTMFDAAMAKDTVVVQVLAVGYSNNQPYLQFLCDMFLRYRAENQDEQGIEPAAWALKSKHFKELIKLFGETNKENQDKHPFTIASAAIDSFFKRVCTALMYNPQTAICDSLERISEYILNAVDFVSSLASKQETSCPFQWDCNIVVNNVKTISMIVGDELSGDEDDDHGDDDDSKYNEGKFVDVLGDVKNRLHSETSFFITKQVDDDTNNDNKNSIRSIRLFNETFDKFRKQQIKNGFEGYPRRYRFCSIIDRRSYNKKKNILSSDEYFIYDPPTDCRKLPDAKSMVPEWYFDSSKTCLIPNIGYKNGAGKENEKLINNPLEKESKSTTTSSSSCKGALICLSFHAESTNVIRCYMYICGQITRFLPSDIIDVLPKFFDKDYGNNKHFPKSNRAKQMVNQMKNKLRDVKFEAFYKQNR